MREREREREGEDSNTLSERNKDVLSIANLFKKSFSLVEAAIYLMLVGVLTTAVIGGAALVEKAKIQKVIEDIDYYEKAFVQFTIQFGQTPGALTLERCEEHIDAFKSCIEYQKNKVSNLYSTFDKNNSRGHYMFAPLQLATTGYINTTEHSMEKGAITAYGVDYSYDFAVRGMKVKYKKNARADFYSHDNGIGGYKTNGFCDYYEQFREPNKGLYLVFFENHKNVNKQDGWNIRRDGLFSPKTMEKIDKKFDDGLPRQGKIQALKQGTSSDFMSICYDQDAGKQEQRANPAKYHKTTTTLQNGCDLFYFLPDVSGYAD